MTTTNGFAETGLSEPILSVVAMCGFTIPTPIQARAIPVALTGVDVIGIAQTGTGKTLAFALPTLEKMTNEHGRCLIIVPTRELALQVEESILNISSRMRPAFRTACLIGGISINRQFQDLRMRPRIIIATPGRLQDHLDQRSIDLRDVTTLVLDEADRMLDMGFLPQIKRILLAVPEERQTMLFSATMAPEVTKLGSQYMHDPIRVEVARPGTAAEDIEQQLLYVGADRKPEMLETLLNRYDGSVLVFSRTKHGAAKLSRRLIMSGYNAAEIHSNKSLGQRRQALDGFKSGRYRVLIATDIAARGIDVENISLVVNYDLPDVAEDYVHRIGRTGRAGKTGLAISMAGHDQYGDVKSIERLMNRSLALSEYSDEPRHAAASIGLSAGRSQQGNRGPRGGRPGQSGQGGPRNSGTPGAQRRPQRQGHVAERQRPDGEWTRF